MSDRFGDLIRDRSAVAGVAVDEALGEQLSAYLSLLSQWNRTINLTSFELDTPTPAAIDRLVIEPVLAARLVRPDDRLSIDIGSGGGSPAIPLRLARPELEMVMVESRGRKAAFLREAARSLSLSNVHVEATTFEALAASSSWAGRADLVTMRAVRPEASIWAAAKSVLRLTGRFLWFANIGETTNYHDDGFIIEDAVPPVIVLRIQGPS